MQQENRRFEKERRTLGFSRLRAGVYIRRYNLKSGIITMLGLYVDLDMKFFDAVPEIFLQTAI